MSFSDSAGEPTIVGLTPRLIPVVAKVMGPPETQLQATTRTQLTQLVKYVYQKQSSLIQPYPVLLQAIQA